MFLNTGSIIAGRPSMGSWLLYGLGADTENLPGFVVMLSAGRGGQMQPISARQWSAGFLPSKFQGVKLNSFGNPVLYLDNPTGIDATLQRQSIDAIDALDRDRYKAVEDQEILTRISQYEMAFKMQTSVPGSGGYEQGTAERAGLRTAPSRAMARSPRTAFWPVRLAERGVRFIQLYHRDWDHHSAIKDGIEFKAEEVDRPTAALITDLKQRGMLDDTLVVFGGEFGRTPMSQGGDGRDHHIKTFSYLLAGGGIKPGLSYGTSDELGYAAVDNPVSIHDFHATMLRVLGIDDMRMTVKYSGLDARLSGVGNQGEVVTGILT